MSEYLGNEGTIKVEAPKKEDFDEYEQSALIFKNLCEQFNKKGYKLADKKKRALVRVIGSFLFEPLETIQLFGKEEKEMVDLCRSIMYHKMKINEYAIIKSQKLNEENEDGKR